MPSSLTISWSFAVVLHVFTPGSRVYYDASVNSKSIHVASNKPCLCYTHTEATSKPQVRYLVHREDVHKYCFIYFRPHQLRHTSRCNGSTSTMSCAATTCVRPQRLYINYAVRHRSTSRQSVALALAVRPITPSRGATTHRPDCTGSTAHMSCIWMHRLDTRLLVSRSHWLSPCAWSFCCVS
jgi:hypothetical protein